MLYNLVLARNKPYSNTLMAHLPDEVGKEWNKVFSDENHAKYGVKWVVYCDTAWCSEDYSVFAVNTYKDIPARISHWKEIEKAAWYQYADLFTLLGTSDAEPQMPDFPNPIYQLFIVRNDPATAVNLARESKEEATTRDAKWQESIKRTGACIVLFCDSYWANEDYLGFGVIAFPSVEARQAHASDLLELGWNKYYSAFTLLGIARE
jgi:hypothetical protein